MKLDKKVEKRKRVEEVTALVCPDCGGTNVVYEGGLLLGQKYHCVDCHYRGTFILERKVIIEDDEKIREV